MFLRSNAGLTSEDDETGEGDDLHEGHPELKLAKEFDAEQVDCENRNNDNRDPDGRVVWESRECQGETL